jgi:SecD/SecF fusion protein
MTIAVVFLLYVFGGPGLHLFAFIMMIGVIIGTFSSIYIASPLLLMFGEGKHEDATAPGAPKPVAAGIPEGAFKAAEEG